MFPTGSFTRIATTSVTEPAVGPSGFSATPSTAVAGGTTTVNWTSIGTPAPLDWIGLYAANAPDSAFLDWKFVSCSRTPGSALATGACAFTLPATFGTYEFRLFSNNTMTRVATSGAVSVGAQSIASFSASPSVAAGGTLNVSWSGLSPAAPRDWIGLYPSSSAADNAYSSFVFVSCTQTPSTAVPSGSCSMPAPSTSGNYELRIFGNGSFTHMGVFDFTVGPPTVTTFTAPPSVTAGMTVSVYWSGVSQASPTDWIGLYPSASAPANGFVTWIYTSSCDRSIGARGMATGSCSFTVPPNISEGTTYEMRLFSANTQVQIGSAAGPISINVLAPLLTVDAPAVAPGTNAWVTWNYDLQPSSATDWIGLFPSSSAPDTGFLNWEYVSCTRTPGSAAIDVGGCLFQVPQTLGTTYEFRLFAANGFTRIVTSNAFAVHPTVTLSGPSAVRSGMDLAFAWSDLDPPSATDWVGLYPVGAPDQGGFVTWEYLSSCTRIANTSVEASGLCDGITAPAPGSYEIRVFADDGFVKMATMPITVW
jgi:hypothetical protein